jgi:hypothetical protein
MTGRWFKVGVAGESFSNADGISRQMLIKFACRRGCKIELRREPNNKHDSDAVAVWARRKAWFGLVTYEGQIGYIPADRVLDEISSWIDRGGNVEARLHQVNGGTRGRKSRGVVIECRKVGDPKDLPRKRKGR